MRSGLDTTITRAARLAAAFLACVLSAAPVGANPRATPTHIVVDLETGAILAGRDVDAPRWPASLAKMMTVYLAFEAMAEGRIDPGALVTITEAAASQRPMRLGLRRGERVAFEDLVAATAVASANDAAVAVAVALAGSETAFVARMNETARRLGMRNTVYATPNGLPRPGQRTTARDVAILARALMRGHPQRSAVFRAIRGVAGGRRYRATNGLLGRYAGALGLKTGFTCRAGWHLAAAAERDGRRVIAVILGARSSARRLRSAAGLLDLGFARLADPAASRTDETLAPAIATFDTGPPHARACSPTDLFAGARLSGWGVFLGVAESSEAAEALAARGRLTANTRGRVYAAERRDGTGWAAVLNGYGRAEAIRVCAALRRAGAACLTLAPEVLLNVNARWR